MEGFLKPSRRSWHVQSRMSSPKAKKGCPSLSLPSLQHTHLHIWGILACRQRTSCSSRRAHPRVVQILLQLGPPRPGTGRNPKLTAKESCPFDKDRMGCGKKRNQGLCDYPTVRYTSKHLLPFVWAHVRRYKGCVGSCV